MGIGDENTCDPQAGSSLLLEDVLQCITWGANKSGMATLAIKSAHFGTYLRMDGWGPYPPTKGGGIVNCQPFIGIRELFRLVPQEDGSVGIQSVHSGNFLRMDGESVMDNAGGVVNCQSFVGFMEKFSIHALEGGAVAIRSTSYNTYLRMDAINAASQPIQTGGGSVNCSKEIRSWERFYIEAIKPVVALKSLACKLYLRVDCCGSNTAAEGSRRVVSGQHYLGAWEKFILVRADDGTVSLKSEAFKTFYLSVHIHPQGEDTGGQQQQQHHPSPPPPQHQHATVTVSEELQSKFLMHFQPSGSVVFENVDVVKDSHLYPPSSPSSPPSSPPPPSPSPSPPPRTTRPLYLSMAANGTVSCSPPPICNNHCFVIVVDT